MAAKPEEFTCSDLPERAYRALVEAAPDIVIVFAREGHIRYVNGAITRTLGYQPAELSGRPIFDFFHPDDIEKARERVRSILAEDPAAPRRMVYRLRHRDGTYRHLETLAINRVADLEIDGIYAVARDVTQQAQTESSRLATEQRRRLAAEIARIGIWEWNLETGALEADEAVRELVRQRAGQTWTGPKEFLQRFVEEDRAAINEAMQAAIAGKATCRQVARMPLPDGSTRWIYVYAQRQTATEGTSPWVFGLVMDVTEQKRAEEEARHRGDMLELASRGAGVGTWSWYPQQDWADMDEISLELHGLPGSHTRRPTMECNSTTHPDDLAELNRLEEDLSTGLRDRFDFAYRARRPDGGWRWLMDRSRVTARDAEGRVTRVSGITIDIDSEKAREAELAEQRLRLALALKASRQGLWDYDVEKGEQYVDERYVEITGLDPGEVLRHPTLFNELIHEQDRPRFVTAASGCIAGDAAELSFEGRLMAPDGRLKWISVDGAVVRLKPDGTAARLVGTLSDITERRRMDQLVRVGEFVAATGSYEYDAGADRFYWSRGTYRVFGYPEDFVPRRGAITSLLLAGSRPKTLQALRALREEGREFDIEIEAHTARGQPIWVRMMGRAETFAGRPVRFYGIVQDVTARKRLESALIDTANREQQRLGRELHDGLGQELTGIAMRLQGLHGQLRTASPGLAGPVEHLGGLLSAAIRNTRMLAHGLAPVSAGQGGLEAALQRLADQSASAYGIPVSVTLDLRRPVAIDEIAGGNLYRICQEALSNAVRHGRPSRVQISLSSTPESLSLEVLDDGIGIATVGERGAGMGLQSMAYRAENLHGTVEVARRPTGGTRVSVRIPLTG
jgi:PAS domain S-box-containing protein